jgi:hypothetical protein
MKPIKEQFKEKHGKKFQDCNFGLTDFNLKKRKLSPEEAATANKPGGGKGGGPKPKPTPTPTPTQGGTIFLDFTGYIVSNTSWNFNGDIVCEPANLTAEQVDEIVLNVTNEYAPYNVDVTTDEAVYNAQNPMKRVRCILTETWEWYGQAGGVSFIGSFTWGDNTPCFVFTSLLNYNTKYIKEAAAHEIGHSLGLYHQASYDANCIKTSEYNYGNGVEAPIMGVGYYVPDAGTKWWIGPTPYGCDQIQNDDQIIGNLLGRK